MVDYGQRFYRQCPLAEDSVAFHVRYRASDLCLVMDEASYHQELLAEVHEELVAFYASLEKWGGGHPHFFRSHVPYAVSEDAPPVIQAMAQAARVREWVPWLPWPGLSLRPWPNGCGQRCATWW